MGYKYYSLKPILSKNCRYNIIFGERSRGKTTAILEYCITQYVEKGEQSAYIRRWDTDITGKRAQAVFADLESRDRIRALTGGEWTGVYYYASKWYFCAFDEKGNRYNDEKPFMYGFALSAQEHDKGASYPGITTVFFDEFLSRSVYHPDEFVLFCQVLSTIIRHRDNVKIFMAGNSITKYCPYFSEMGITNIKKQEPGTIDLYTYGDSGLTVAVEYTAPDKKGKASDVYFAFKNPKLSMITGGGWELALYPHCPCKYTPGDVIFTYFIYFDGELLQAEVIATEDLFFTFIHRKTSKLQAPDEDLIYSPEFSARPNWRRNITKPGNETEKRIARYYQRDKVFYQDNEVGDIVHNYLKWCSKN